MIMLQLQRAISTIAQLIHHPLREEQISHVCMHCDKLLKGPKDRKYPSHGICNECMEKFYPEVVEEDLNEPAVA